jgi:thiol-disulfide isomerase/thioredoxin
MASELVLAFSSRVVITLLLLSTVAACDKQSTAPSQPNGTVTATVPANEPESTGALDMTQRGSAMPVDVFADPDGKPVTLASFKGKPLLVNLWATWCGPCVKELPSLDRLAARGAGKLTVLIINQDSKKEQGVDPVPGWWAAHTPANLKLYRDAKTDLGFAYASGQLPTTVLYDAQGKEVWRIVGGMNWEGPRANTLLAGVLG